jgi:hypothetical protein
MKADSPYPSSPVLKASICVISFREGRLCEVDRRSRKRYSGYAERIPGLGAQLAIGLDPAPYDARTTVWAVRAIAHVHTEAAAISLHPLV